MLKRCSSKGELICRVEQVIFSKLGTGKWPNVEGLGYRVQKEVDAYLESSEFGSLLVHAADLKALTVAVGVD